MVTQPQIIDEAEVFRVVLSSAVSAMMPHFACWSGVLIPIIEAQVDVMIARGELPIPVADALDDFGQFCQRAGGAIIEAREARGLPMPDGLED